MKYERLTNQEWGENIDLTQELGYSYIYKRLHELEDKIEQGTLIELPCKVGDKFYICYTCPPEYKELEACGYREINGMLEVCDGLNNWYSVNELLFTREEAEKRLKELQE